MPRSSPPPSARRGAIDRPVDPGTLSRFAADLDALVAPGSRIGLGVSGGPDSLALLLLAAAARPGDVEAASVDHGLRPASRAEAVAVARLCAELDVAHTVLTVTVEPGASLQAKARSARYAALADWAEARRLSVLATAHHADDQAETLLMRLARGSGLGGLTGIRPARRLKVGLALVRPLLGWRKSELVAIVAAAGLTPADDPSNRDPRHDRTRIRAKLAENDWLDPAALARSATHLNQAEEALEWAATRLAADRIGQDEPGVWLDPAGVPAELLRRLLLAAFVRLDAPPPRGPELERATAALLQGRPATLSGLKLDPGARWRIAREAPRRGSSETR